MRLRDRDRPMRRVHAQHVRAQSRHRLTQKTSAAPKIDHRETVERLWSTRIAAKLSGDLIDQVAQTHRLHLVQWRKLTFWIPPFGGDRLKFLDLFRIYPRRCLWHLISLLLPCEPKHLVKHRACGAPIPQIAAPMSKTREHLRLLTAKQNEQTP